MRRPHWRSAMFAAVSGAFGLAILAGCTTRQSGLSASDETARYLQNARGVYVIPGPPSDPWGPYIREASARYDIPEPWIRALMRQESGGNLYRGGRLITSSAGAMGLMQVMPGTYAELRARYSYLGPDPFDPHDNIMAGVAYMHEMYEMYGSPGFLAAYNAGPNRLDDYLANQRALPDETRRYVAAIGPSLQTASPRVRSPAEQFAMNQLPVYIPPGPRYGYGSGVQVPTVQMASAGSTYRPPVFTQAAVQPAYTPAAYAPPAYTPPAPRVLAWAEPPKPAYVPVPQARQPALAWTEPARPVYAPPPQRTVVAQSHSVAPGRVTLAMAPMPPASRHGGGFHLISGAMAAEVYPARHGHKNFTIPVSYIKPEHGHESSPWKLHATGPQQASPGCHKNLHGKSVCGPERL
jgi:Transglycosylase SLT domain